MEQTVGQHSWVLKFRWSSLNNVNITLLCYTQAEKVSSRFSYFEQSIQEVVGEFGSIAVASHFCYCFVINYLGFLLTIPLHEDGRRLRPKWLRLCSTFTLGPLVERGLSVVIPVRTARVSVAMRSCAPEPGA
jgi:hypothetical protein